ncbi:pilus assembly protein PilW [Vibrio makurazakiensis]|uniref:PilW family protein n=1 Tax=Vibrio makurazakiensis TaxID=2910250 RepID=UPI003D12657C
MAMMNVVSLGRNSNRLSLVGVATVSSQNRCCGTNKQKGATLVEMVIASSLGLVAIVGVGSIFLSGQKISNEKGKQLLLLQQVSGALQYFKQDLQRAGYDGGNGNSLTLSGTSDIIYVAPDFHSVAYAYTHGTQVRNVAFVFDSGAIKVCDRPSTAPKTVSQAVSGCSSIFEPNQITVTNFLIQTSHVATSSVSSGMTTLSIAAELASDASVTYSTSVDIQHRSWQ